MSVTPLIAAVLPIGRKESSKKDKEYALYSAGYGIEMQIDNEWKVDVVLLTPEGLLHALTKKTAVTGSDTVIVSAGVTDVPVGWTGTPKLSEITDPKNNWLLIAAPGHADSEKHIKRKLKSALAGGCRVILCFSEIGTEQLRSRLSGITADAQANLVLAFTGTGADDVGVATRAVRFAREAAGENGAARMIVGGCLSARSAVTLTAIKGVDGVLLLDDYGDFDVILTAARAIDRARQA